MVLSVNLDLGLDLEKNIKKDKKNIIENRRQTCITKSTKSCSSDGFWQKINKTAVSCIK